MTKKTFIIENWVPFHCRRKKKDSYKAKKK